jgi:hypothetical protein
LPTHKAGWPLTNACYVYAIVGRDTPLPCVGADAAPVLAMVSWRGLAAVTGDVGDDQAILSMEAVRRHEAVVEAVRQRGPALPVRFGTVFRDATSVASALAGRYEPLEADLGRLGDKVEMGVTALWAAETPAGGTDNAPREAGTLELSAGARYLRSRAAEVARDDAQKERAITVVRKLDRVFGARALERRVSLRPASRVAFRISYLLHPAHVCAFKAAFETTHAAIEEVRLLLTGPWSPYSFVHRAKTEDGTSPDGRLAALVELFTKGRLG